MFLIVSYPDRHIRGLAAETPVAQPHHRGFDAQRIERAELGRDLVAPLNIKGEDVAIPAAEDVESIGLPNRERLRQGHHRAREWSPRRAAETPHPGAALLVGFYRGDQLLLLIE